MFIQCIQEAMLILEETTGLGQMGHGMAKSLRQKISKDSILVVYDINRVGLEQFIKDFSSSWTIIVSQCPREVAEIAVRAPFQDCISLWTEHAFISSEVDSRFRRMLS